MQREEDGDGLEDVAGCVEGLQGWSVGYCGVEGVEEGEEGGRWQCVGLEDWGVGAEEGAD